MKVNELISLLNKIEDKDRRISLCIETDFLVGTNYTQYEIAECGDMDGGICITGKQIDGDMCRKVEEAYYQFDNAKL